ncbi:MAG: hypothetical protein C9356_07925 [Oleiphilus sp.]|nr:MAG: hypothetical protein C9356_07925 [Oleiphilus sp.]
MIYGIGISGTGTVIFGGGGEGKVQATLIWDHCGDAGILVSVELAAGIGEDIGVCASIELPMSVKRSISPSQLGGGCVSEMAGGSIGVDGNIEARWGPGAGIGLGGDWSPDSDIISGTLSLDLGLGTPGASLSGHGTYSWLIPIVSGNCPCNLGLGWRLLGMLPVIGHGIGGARVGLNILSKLIDAVIGGDKEPGD